MTDGAVKVDCKRCVGCTQVLPIESFASRKDRKSGRASRCRRCNNDRRRLALESAPEKVEEYRRRKREAAYRYDVDPCKRKKYNADFYCRNASRLADSYRANAAQWLRSNPDKAAMKKAARRAKKLCATPEWANRFFISEAYHLAQLRSLVTGFPWAVDHIVPLNSRLVCGLHVEHNLAVIPARLNSSKGNRSWPEMP